MPQRPRAGGQTRAASAKAGARESVAKTDPAVTEEPVVTQEPASAELAGVEPVGAETVSETEPTAEAAPPIAEAPVTTAEPMAEAGGQPGDQPTYTVQETIAATSDLAAASAKAVSATIKETADTVAAVAAEAVETASTTEPTQPTLTQGLKKMIKSTEDFVAFNQANLEAFVKSGQIWSAGVQELTRQIATSAKASFDESVSTFKAMSTAKSVKEAMDLQSNFAKSAFEKAMAESNKLTDASIKLTEQTLAPITARVTSAVEAFGKAA